VSTRPIRPHARNRRVCWNRPFCRRSRAGALYIFIFLIASLCLAGRPVNAQGLNPIQQENSLPGTPNWDGVRSSTQQDLINGFGSAMSVNHGGSIDFYVTTKDFVGMWAAKDYFSGAAICAGLEPYAWRFLVRRSGAAASIVSHG
jgi:hypothetical protein